MFSLMKMKCNAPSLRKKENKGYIHNPKRSVLVDFYFVTRTRKKLEYDKACNQLGETLQ